MFVVVRHRRSATGSPRVDGQQLSNAFPQAGRRRRPFPLQPRRMLLHLSATLVLHLRQVAQDVPHLVISTTLRHVPLLNTWPMALSNTLDEHPVEHQLQHPISQPLVGLQRRVGRHLNLARPLGKPLPLAQ